MRVRTLRVFTLASVAALFSACGGAASGGSDSGAVALSAVAALGEKIFSDASLSASGRLSCARCHDPPHGHSSASTDVLVPAAGADLTVPGFRKAPSLRYLNQAPAFFFHTEGTPTGGLTRHGKVDTLREQAATPFLANHEMANSTPASVVAKLASARYADDFNRIFGAAIFDDADAAFDHARLALQMYQLEDTEVHAFASKYDHFLAGTTALTSRELLGLALFNDPAKGNCAACHPSARGADASPPLLTDFSYDNLGVPRNMAIAANADPAYFDLGLCGPFRTDLGKRSDLCGAFKIPTLRNVVITAPYFHNGRFKTLKEAVGFYVCRDTNPEEWYPLNADGSVRKFDDLPPQYHANVNVTEAPYNRRPGQAPALTSDEVDLVVEFLGTLTNGHQP